MTYKKQKYIYLLAVVLSMIGVITSLLLGPGTVAPQMTGWTVFSLVALFAGEFMAARSNMLANDRATSTSWTLGTIALLILTFLPLTIMLFLISILWVIVLPALTVCAVVLLFQVIKAT